MSPCTASDSQTGRMTGTRPPKRGHLFAFGNTEESSRIMILGTNRRGNPNGEPFDHETGEGYVAQRDGDYVDARQRGKQTIPLIAEVFGGLTPHSARFLRQLSRVAAKHTSRDSTKYGRLARSFSDTPSATASASRTPSAIVMTDALNICDGITKLKKRTLIQRRAA